MRGIDLQSLNLDGTKFSLSVPHNTATALPIGPIPNQAPWDVLVVGGLSRLLNHVTSTFRESTIHYWVDLRYGDGHSLHQLGFNHERDINSFEWTDYIFRYHRLYSRNNRTDRMSRIFDAGQRLFIRQKGSSDERT